VNEHEINRIREDLEVIRQAAGVDLPFSRLDIWVLTPITCVAGAVMSCVGWWAPTDYRWINLFPAAVVVAAWLFLARLAHRRRATQPVGWREARYGLLAMLIFMPVFIGFIVWEATLGRSRVAVGSSAMFFLGLIIAWFAVVDRTRRFYAGTAIPLIVFGLTIPYCDSRQVGIGAGLMVIAVAIMTAAIQEWQLRDQRRKMNAN
jgi:MFS family permease